MSDDSIVILSHPTALATKRFWLGEDGATKVEPYGNGKFFQAEVVPLAGLADLYMLLQVLVGQSRTFCIRGEPIPGTSLTSVRRLSKAKDGDPPSFREHPRRWMMVDVDGLDPKLKADWSTAEGCAAAADMLMRKMPLELRSAGYIWQASSSAGIKPGLRMHFWFFLDRPLGETELERWGENVNDVAGKKVVDVAPFRTVQPHYTANPVFDTGILDPVALRLGYVPGAPAVLPRSSARADTWKRKLEPLYFDSNDKIHDHVRDACASYFCAHGPDSDATPLRLAVDRAVERAKELQGRDDYDDACLNAEVESGREFARGRAAAGENLLLDGQGAPRGGMANILSVLLSHDDWRNMLAWNTRAGRIEILRSTPWGAQPGEWTDSRDSAQTCLWFAREKRMAVDDGTVLRAVIAASRENEVDPVVDWLNTLEWDGVERLSGWMIGWCGAEDSSYVRAVSRMFLIGCIARAMIPGCKNDTVLCLEGATGIGKSTLLEILGGEWYAALTDEKDMLQKIHGPWLMELPELGPFRGMHYNKIKSFTSTRIDRFRAPYMRLPEDRGRTCALAATLNPEGVGWQEDATGARRFWPVEVTKIDRVAIEAAREQLFAEALVAFRAGEKWWVEDPNDPRFVAAQAKIYATDTWEALFRKVLTDGGKTYGPGGREHVIFPGGGKNGFELGDLMAVAFQDFRVEKRDHGRASRALLILGYHSVGTLWRKMLTPAEGSG